MGGNGVPSEGGYPLALSNYDEDHHEPRKDVTQEYKNESQSKKGTTTNPHALREYDLHINEFQIRKQQELQTQYKNYALSLRNAMLKNGGYGGRGSNNKSKKETQTRSQFKQQHKAISKHC